MTDIRPYRPQALSMEGPVARWYARIRGTAPQLAAVRTQAAQLTAGLPEGGRILEVAPGPGYLAVELARLGFDVTGVDLGATFVRLATDAARRAGVDARFLHADAADLPLPDTSFDLVVCQAAFKNFGRPVAALDEMHRVLRPGGVAVIGDMNRDATTADIRREVDRMGLGRLNAASTRITLSGLRRRAYAADHFRVAAAASAFGGCEVRAEGLGLEVRLTRGA
jgi:ubiquinone/menaquinone biosynthesis C-methylase UbiE